MEGVITPSTANDKVAAGLIEVVNRIGCARQALLLDLRPGPRHSLLSAQPRAYCAKFPTK